MTNLVRRLGRDVADLAYPAGGLVLLVVLWHAAVVVFKVPRIVMPKPLEVWNAILLNDAMILRNSLGTSLRVLVAFLASVAAAVPLAVLVVEAPLLGRLAQPLITLSQAIPKVALAPLFVVWFGPGVFSQVTFAALIAFFPIFIEAVIGLRSLDREMLLLARSMGSSRRQILVKFRLPKALPHVFAGLKVGVTLAVVGGVVGEWIGGKDGIAVTLLEADSLLNTPLSVASIVILSAMGVAFFLLVTLLERMCMPWRRPVRPVAAPT